MKYPVLDETAAIQNLKAKTNSSWQHYYAFFSTWYGGIIKNPGYLLTLPLDDHGVHRGDGVFEALKSVNRKIYLLKPHLERLQTSAEKIGLKLPYSAQEIEQILLQTLQVADQSETLIRVFLTRGPGSFSANPYDSLASQLYVVVTKLSPPSHEKYLHGVSAGRSAVPVKEGFMPQIKSCNYLPNVMMKKESVDRHLDFTVSFDEQDFLAESATENMLIVDRNQVLTHPPLGRILKGTTMTRVFELAKKNGVQVASRPISENDILTASEVMMAGTTLDILPVTAYDGKPVSDGKVGSMAKSLLHLLQDDMKLGTPF